MEDNYPPCVNSSGRIASNGRGEMTLDEMKVQVDAIMRRYPTSTPIGTE